MSLPLTATKNQRKLHERKIARIKEGMRRHEKIRQERNEVGSKARAEIHAGMNRKRRRELCKAEGVFNYPGLFGQLQNRDELDRKTFKREKHDETA